MLRATFSVNCATMFRITSAPRGMVYMSTRAGSSMSTVRPSSEIQQSSVRMKNDSYRNPNSRAKMASPAYAVRHCGSAPGCGTQHGMELMLAGGLAGDRVALAQRLSRNWRPVPPLRTIEVALARNGSRNRIM